MRKEITLFFIFLLFACSANRDLSIGYQKKIPQSVAVKFSEELEKYKERAFLAIPPFYGQGGYFEVGESLSASLFEGVNSIYQNAVQMKDSDLAAGNYDRIIKFSVQRDECGLMGRGWDLDVDFKDFPGKEYQTQSLRFDVVVLIEVYDGELELMNSKVVRGDGIYRMERIVGSGSDDPYSPTNMGLDKQKNRFKKAINDAIQDVSSKVIKFLRSDFLESNN